MLNLKHALRLPELPRLALVGAGGKTTTLFALARQFPGPALITTTTHLAANQIALADQNYEISSPEQVITLGGAPRPGITLVAGRPDREGRVSGLDPRTLEQLKLLADHWQIPLLIEADGSRMRPLKAPGDHEPSIPAFVDQVAIVAGLTGLGKPLTDAWVHRPDRFASLAGMSPGKRISVDGLARVLTHPQGGLKNIPPGARRRVLLTRADTADLQSKAAALAQRLLAEVDSVVITSTTPDGRAGSGTAAYGKSEPGAEIEVMQVVERVAGIILAAGASHRMGRPKPLLDWKGQPFVRCVAHTALSAGLSPVIVVTGAEAAAVGAAVEDFDLRVVYNPEWESGQAASLRAGLRSIHEEIGAAVFLLADQPQIPASLVRSLVERHASTLAPVIAPLAGGRRANPVLLDRVTFPDLERLSGDLGGRALFSRYPIEWLQWHGEEILLDVDTPEDYQRLLALP